MSTRFLIAVVGVFLFSSCEESMILKSEKKMKEDIQGTWRREFQGLSPFFKFCAPGDTTSYHYSEYWTFVDGKLYTTFEYLGVSPCDRGTKDSVTVDGVDTAIISDFKIDARIFDAFIKFQIISGAQDSAISFPNKWEFVTLDEDVLYLATDDPKNNSVLQLEFLKIK